MAEQQSVNHHFILKTNFFFNDRFFNLILFRKNNGNIPPYVSLGFNFKTMEEMNGTNINSTYI